MTDLTAPWTNGAYSIKRHGISLTDCDSEPVQTPGCIQAHGVLLVLRPIDLTVLQASENTEAFFAIPPEKIVGKAVAGLIGEANCTHLRDVLQQESIENNPFYIFTLPATAQVSALDVTVHTIDNVVVLEFEPTQRTEVSPAKDYFVLVKAAIQRLQASNGLRDFCQSVATEVRQITQLDRVMVYRFHADQHGEVFAESKREDLEPWLGLHYPEADIPKPAREIFKKVWLRPLQNAQGPLIELLPLTNPDTGQPLNMSYCALRGASVMYSEYLANMGVPASLTMPILIDGTLWGLIACHHLTVTHFPYQIRIACELLAQVTSLQLKAVEHREQLMYRIKLEGVHSRLIAKAALVGDLLALSDSHPTLLDAMDAEGVALFHQNRWRCSGKTPTNEQLDALADWLQLRPEFNLDTRPVYVNNALASEYPPGSAFTDVASGVLAVQLSRQQRSTIIWFRPETLQTVNWAGNPYDKPLVAGPHGMRLTPRASFALFVESVRERALPWSEIEIDAALRLRSLILELVISRAERLAELNIDLTNSNEELDAFAYIASHDLKEPLRWIHRYAHQILEGAQILDTENQQSVENLMRLTLRMDNLLDSLLHFSRVGSTNLEFEGVDLNEILQEALEMTGVYNNENTCTIIIPRPLPVIDCDAIRVREIFTNLVANALKYTRHACPRIELGFFAPDAFNRPPTAPDTTQNQLIFYVRDDGIGIEARHFEQIFRMFKRLNGRDDFGGGVGAGLSVVKKVVQRHGGTIWLESAVDVGSCFYFTLSTEMMRRP